MVVGKRDRRQYVRRKVSGARMWMRDRGLYGGGNV